MLYAYFINHSHLTDDQIDALQGHHEVLSAYAPRDIRQLVCFDCQFPNGDVYRLTEDDIVITSCQAV